MTGVHIYNTAVSRRQYTKQANQSTCERISQGVSVHALSTLDSLSANRLSVYLQPEVSLLPTAGGPSARWVNADLQPMTNTANSTHQQHDSKNGLGVLGVLGVSCPRAGRQNKLLTASSLRISGVSWVSWVKSKLSRVRVRAHTRTCAHNRFANRQDTRDTPLTEPGTDPHTVENRGLGCPTRQTGQAGHPGRLGVSDNE